MTYACAVALPAIFLFGTWLTSRAFPSDVHVSAVNERVARWWRRVLVATQIFALVSSLMAVFVLGMWLTWPTPTGFPIDQKLVAVSLNRQPIIRTEHGAKLPTLEVRRQQSSYRFAAGGTGHCNYWNGQIALVPPNFVIWSEVFQTAMGCVAHDSEEKYFRALLGATRWRREEGFLILENDTDIIRFILAPRQ